jgi:hypothetical protein
MPFSLSLQPVVEPTRHVADFSFPSCSCGSSFPCLVLRGRHYFELRRHHKCLHCRTLIARHAEVCGFLIMEEV